MPTDDNTPQDESQDIHQTIFGEPIEVPGYQYSSMKRPATTLTDWLKEKYGQRCAKCGAARATTGADVSVHRLDEEAAFDVENSILLCQSCADRGDEEREEMETFYRAALESGDVADLDIRLSLLQIFGEDQGIVLYRPRWNELTGSVTGTVFLSQVLYWWIKSGRKPFYKFNAPCEHRQYKAGDSWQEELGMSRDELETAREAVAEKTTEDKVIPRQYVTYWRDGGNRTWYRLNEEKLERDLAFIYAEPIGGKSQPDEDRLRESPNSGWENPPTDNSDTTTDSTSLPDKEGDEDKSSPDPDPEPEGEASSKVSHKHPAVQAYREGAHTYPKTVTREHIVKVWDKVKERDGLDDEAAAKRLTDITKKWVGYGWNPHNTIGIMDCFERGYIQKKSGRGRGGNYPATQTGASSRQKNIEALKRQMAEKENEKQEQEEETDADS